MDKILLEIICPATAKTYDFWISKKMSIEMVKQKVIDEIRNYEKNSNIFLDVSQIMFFDEKGNVLKCEKMSIEQLSIQSGQRLMLI